LQQIFRLRGRSPVPQKVQHRRLEPAEQCVETLRAAALGSASKLFIAHGQTYRIARHAGLDGVFVS